MHPPSRRAPATGPGQAGTVSERRSDDQPTRITLCPDGPVLVRGRVEVVGADGTVTTSRRGTVAVCRCGRSAIAPWCDGTHRLGGPRRGVGSG